MGVPTRRDKGPQIGLFAKRSSARAFVEVEKIDT
jgi:hypothetical protein